LEDDLPTSLSVGAQYVTIDAKDSWTWASDSAQVPSDTKIPLRSFLENIEIRRSVYDTKIDAWNTAVLLVVGKVNSAVFRGIPVGCCMFLGADATEVISETTSKRKWQTTLKFAVRRESWQKIWRLGTGWDSPKNGSNFLYEEDTFATLFSTGKTP